GRCRRRAARASARAAAPLRAGYVAHVRADVPGDDRRERHALRGPRTRRHQPRPGAWRPPRAAGRGRGPADPGGSMRICFVSQQVADIRTGVGMYANALIPAVAEAGHRTTLVARGAAPGWQA